MQLQNFNSKPSDAFTQDYIEPDQQKTETSPVEAIQSWLVAKLAKQLSLNANTIDVREPLTRYGLDSIDAVTLVGDLEDWLELELPSTLLWDYPSIEKAAQYLVQEFDVSAGLANAEPEVVKETPKETKEKAPAAQGWGGLWGRISGS